MRKLILIALCFVFSGLLFSENSGNYYISCSKCKEYTKKHRGYSYCLGCPAWRRYDLELGQHEYMVYRCQHGHELHVSYKKTGE